MNWKLGLWALKALVGLASKFPTRQHHPILIVEDDENDAEMIRAYCHKFGATTVWAPTMRKAHDALLTQSFRLAFVDEKLPDGSGVNFVQEIARKCPKLPVSIVTGDDSISEKLHSGRNWSIILKGTSGGSLMEAVEDAILKSNGVNGHVTPNQLVVFQWLLLLGAVAFGYFLNKIEFVVESLRNFIFFANRL